MLWPVTRKEPSSNGLVIWQALGQELVTPPRLQCPRQRENPLEYISEGRREINQMLVSKKKNSSKIFVKIDKRILKHKWRHFPFPPRTEDCVSATGVSPLARAERSREEQSRTERSVVTQTRPGQSRAEQSSWSLACE